MLRRRGMRSDECGGRVSALTLSGPLVGVLEGSTANTRARANHGKSGVAVNSCHHHA